MLVLPSEVWSIIVRHLRRPDPVPGKGQSRQEIHQAELAVCMRVNTLFNNLAESHLYSRVYIDDPASFFANPEGSLVSAHPDIKSKSELVALVTHISVEYPQSVVDNVQIATHVQIPNQPGTKADNPTTDEVVQAHKQLESWCECVKQSFLDAAEYKRLKPTIYDRLKTIAFASVFGPVQMPRPGSHRGDGIDAYRGCKTRDSAQFWFSYIQRGIYGQVGWLKCLEPEHICFSPTAGSGYGPFDLERRFIDRQYDSIPSGLVVCHSNNFGKQHVPVAGGGSMPIAYRDFIPGASMGGKTVWYLSPYSPNADSDADAAVDEDAEAELGDSLLPRSSSSASSSSLSSSTKAMPPAELALRSGSGGLSVQKPNVTEQSSPVTADLLFGYWDSLHRQRRAYFSEGNRCGYSASRNTRHAIVDVTVYSLPAPASAHAPAPDPMAQSSSLSSSSVPALHPNMPLPMSSAIAGLPQPQAQPPHSLDPPDPNAEVVVDIDDNDKLQRLISDRLASEYTRPKDANFKMTWNPTSEVESDGKGTGKGKGKGKTVNQVPPCPACGAGL